MFMSSCKRELARRSMAFAIRGSRTPRRQDSRIGPGSAAAESRRDRPAECRRSDYNARMFRKLALVLLIAVPAFAQRTQKPPLHGSHWMGVTGKPMAATAGAMIFQKSGH